MDRAVHAPASGQRRIGGVHDRVHEDARNIVLPQFDRAPRPNRELHTRIVRHINSPMAASSRLQSVDALRGAIMIVMALDHIRDFFHSGAMLFSPTDLTRTTAAIFFTRWITHFCAPVFFFTAAAGAFLWSQRGHTR